MVAEIIKVNMKILGCERRSLEAEKIKKYLQVNKEGYCGSEMETRKLRELPSEYFYEVILM